MGWMSLFPEEMEIGDMLGEEGELIMKTKEPICLCWTLVFATREPEILQGPTRILRGLTVYECWPERAPLRLLRRD